MKRVLIIGIILSVISIGPLFMMAREVTTRTSMRNKYLVEPIWTHKPGTVDKLDTTINGHSVRLEDNVPPSKDPEARVLTPIRIVIDGKDWSSSVSVDVRPAFQDANRYWGYVRLLKLMDRASAVEQVVVAQKVGLQSFRLLMVNLEGKVVEDNFDFKERGHPPIRADLIRDVAGHPIGYYSDLMQVWPSLFYPVLFPWASGGIGLLCILIGIYPVLNRNSSRGASA